MEAIEDAAAAAGTLPWGSPPELLQSKKYRASAFDYAAGLEHHTEGDVQLEADLDLRDRPVKATLKIQVYETGELALDAFGNYGAVLDSEHWTSVEDYSSAKTSLYGYYASASVGEGMVEYFYWFAPGRGYKSTALHASLVEIGGTWFLISVRVRGHGGKAPEIWGNFTGRARELADLLLASVTARLELEPDPTPTAEPEPTEEPEEESAQARLERRMAQSLIDYRVMAREFLASLKVAYFNEADHLMRAIRNAKWFIENDLAENRAERRAELAALEQRAESLLDRFDRDTEQLRGILDEIDSQFFGEPGHDELSAALEANRSELRLTELNLALRTGHTEAFDELFREYRTNPDIAPDVLTANAYRQLMDGETRLALESAKKALDLEPRNPTATRIVRDLEVEYLRRIREKLAGEKSESARLFNAKLNGHGEQGKAQVVIDILTTGLSESVQAIAGYYDIMESVASLNIDEATREIAGIMVIESLRKRGYDFDDISTMTTARLKVILVVEYDRELGDDDVEGLRKKLFAGLQNLDVNAIRRGDRTQYAVDIGTSYFDTEVLQQNKADFVARQFSALDTFMTFAPSARLGTLAEGSLFGRLGLTGEATFGQAMVKGSKVEELGRRIYQTKWGSAVLDTGYQFDAATKMIGDAIKNRVGDIAYEAGGTLLSAAIDELSKPMKDALKEELRKISDLYLGTDVTAGIEGTVGTITGIFNWAGINTKALQRGAHGVDRLQEVGKSIDAEARREIAMLGDPAIATAGAGTPFSVFAEQAGDGSYLAGLRLSRRRIAGMARPDAGARELLKQADDMLDGMGKVAAALQSGNTSQARTLYESLQNTTGALLQGSLSRRSSNVANLQGKLAQIASLGFVPPTGTDIAKAIKAKFAPAFETGSKAGDVAANAVTAAGWVVAR